MITGMVPSKSLRAAGAEASPAPHLEDGIWHVSFNFRWRVSISGDRRRTGLFFFSAGVFH